MHTDLLTILRCPYCGGRLELVTNAYYRTLGDDIHDGILACQCCTFPVVDGIPVMHLLPDAVSAREQIDAQRPQEALRTMVGVANDAQASVFEAAASNEASTYRDVVESLGPTFEGGYFLYRFSDPTYIVANAVVHAVAGTVLGGKRRAVDVCGGSGHLTRSLIEHSSPAPVLADLYFAKVWLARRFTAPGCEPVCCDGNAPLPFARGVFGYAMCSDAFQYIWTKRQFIGELSRLVDGPESGAVVINHTHNQLTWSPSHGQPLSPDGYVALFETIEPRIFGEAGLFKDVVEGRTLDLSRRDTKEALDSDPALTIIASRRADVYRAHPIDTPLTRRGELRINPLYAIERRDQQLHLRLRFPSPDYEDEYGACREYLPDEVVIPAAAVAALNEDPVDLAPGIADLVRRRVILDLPRKYY